MGPASKGIWIEDHLPPFLLHRGPADLLLWQWLALPLGLCVAWLIGVIFSRVTRLLLLALARRTANGYDDKLFERLGGPITLAWAALISLLELRFLALPAEAQQVGTAALKAAFLIAFFWSLLRGADVALVRMEQSDFTRLHPAARSLLPVLRRITQLCVLALAVVGLLAEVGYPVASLIAGLGVGGLAFALAAQKTLENLFGAFSLGLDRPFVVGDFVKVEDFLGTVESIGFRSTRIRTLDRTLITLPNGKLAEMRIESYAARDRLRFACDLGLVYGTSASQVREVLQQLERVLKEHPKVWPDGITAKLKELGQSALTIETSAWFKTADVNEFQDIRQDTLLAFLEVIERAGTRLAFPTRTLELKAEAAKARAPAAESL
jgi:MscS family membrane protein